MYGPRVGSSVLNNNETTTENKTRQTVKTNE